MFIGVRKVTEKREAAHMGTDKVESTCPICRECELNIADVPTFPRENSFKWTLPIFINLQLVF